jgi:SAM-dependent methyltransferase
MMDEQEASPVFPEVLYELFRDMPRQGPGDNYHTRKAYEMLPGLPGRPRILDIGCGSGMQTLELARLSGGQVTGLDNHQYFLDTLAESAKKAGLDKQLTTVNASMFALPFAAGTFDIIWAEGAIFIIGFEKGLRDWEPLLKPGGYLVVSELAWITPDRPGEVSAYMEAEYPAIKNDGENREIIRRAGYDMVGSFILPESVWQHGFYKPYQARLDLLKQKYAGNSEVSQVLADRQPEIDMYNKYSRYYSYIFYLMRSK